MRKLTQLWPALERITGLLTIPAYWEHFCGPDIAVIRPFLRATEMTGGAYLCGGRLDRPVCLREIVDYGSGEIVAVCRDQWKRCQDLPLSRRETILHSLDVSAVAQAIARPLGFRWHPPVVKGHNTWSIGLAADGFGTDRQVILMAHSEPEHFRMALHGLLAGIEEPFILLCPTSSHKDPGVHETLARRRVRFHALEDHLGVDEAGIFSAIRPLVSDSGVDVPLTPVGERAKRVQSFAAKHGLTIKEMLVATGVDYRDFKRWRKGDLDNASSKSRRIEAYLATAPAAVKKSAD
jgi:hypothetical protein